MASCYKCGKAISSDEVGLNKKIINRGIEQFMCISCLASYFKSSEQSLREMIEQFRAAGCMLFARPNKNQ